MHPFVSQALARQHQGTPRREATYEHLSRSVHQQTPKVPTPPVVFSQRSCSEPDFAAIRRDLYATLSEWCLESGTASFDAAIDTFMQRLRMRLGDNEQQCTGTKFFR